MKHRSATHKSLLRIPRAAWIKLVTTILTLTAGVITAVLIPHSRDKPAPSTAALPPVGPVQTVNVPVTITVPATGVAPLRPLTPTDTSVPSTGSRGPSAPALAGVCVDSGSQTPLQILAEAETLYDRTDLVLALQRYECAYAKLSDRLKAQLPRQQMREAFSAQNRTPKEVAQLARYVHDLFGPIEAALHNEEGL